MIKQVLIALLLRLTLAQIIEQCKSQKAYYDLSYQECGACEEFCSSCLDQNSCVVCQDSYYYDLTSQKCGGLCRSNEFYQKFFQRCVGCDIQNCQKCNFEQNICQQCNKGWKLTKDQKYCQKEECLVNEFYKYDLESEICTLNCPEYADLNQRVCTNLKKFSTIKMTPLKQNIKQVEINQIFYYQQQNGNEIIAALDNSNFVFYSFENLIPISSSKLLGQYEKAIQYNDSIYLISQSIIQKIYLEEMNIQIINSNSNNGFWTFSQENYYQPQQIQSIFIYAYNFLQQQSYNYTFQNYQQINFNQFTISVSSSDDGNADNNANNLAEDNQILSSQPLGDYSYTEQFGCQIPNITVTFTDIVKQNINLIQRDFLQETILQQQVANQLEQNYGAYDLESIKKVVLVLQNELYLIDQLNTTTLIDIEYFVDKDSIVDIFEYDKKIRIVMRYVNKYQNIYQAAIICTNLTQNQTSSEYYIEYPHFALTTSEIIEHQIFENQQQLILASSIGYEVININGNLSQYITNSSQNLLYIFNQLNNQVHIKFVSSSSALTYKIENSKINIYQLNFNSTMFSLSECLASLNQYDYLYFDVGIYKTLLIKEKLVIALSNQIQIIDLSAQKNITYSLFVDFNIATQMKGIQKLITYHEKKWLIILFNTGFRIIQQEDQVFLYEKNLFQQIIKAEISNQNFGIVYQFQSSYNFVIFNLDTFQMHQFDIKSTSIYINMIQQENPSILFIAVYDANIIKLICLSEQKQDIFQINATVLLTDFNYDNTLQALNNTIYISTLEYSVIVLNYNQLDSTLIQIDSFYTLDGYINFDNKFIILNIECDFIELFLYDREQQRIIYKVIESYINNYEGQLQYLNLKSQTYQMLHNYNMLAQNEVYFILDYNNQYKLVEASTNQTSDLSFPFQISVLQSQIIQIEQINYILIKNIFNENYLYNLKKNQIEQFLQLSAKQNFTFCNGNQVILYESGDVRGNLLLSKSYSMLIMEQSLDDSMYLYQIKDFYGFLSYTAQLVYYFNNLDNQLTQINVQQQPNINFSRKVQLVGLKQILAHTLNGQVVVYDAQANTIHRFVSQSYVTYVSELEAFISVNENNQLILQKQIDYQIQYINLSISDKIIGLGYELVNFKIDSILIRINIYAKQMLYIYDFISQKGNRIYFQDDNFYSIQMNYYYNIICNDNLLIIFLTPSASFFKIQQNGQYQLESYNQYNSQFSSSYLQSQIIFNKFNNTIVQFQVLPTKLATLKVFDYTLTQLICQLSLQSSQSYLFSESEGVIYSVNENNLSKLNYLNCSIQNTPMYGIQFITTSSLFLFNIFIFEDKYLDLIAIMSQNRSNIFQSSTLSYLGSIDYDMYDQDSVANYNDLTNTISIISFNKILLLDLWTPLLTQLYQGSLKNNHPKKKNFLYYNEQNIGLQFDFNTGVLNTLNLSKQQIIHQFKLRDSFQTTRYYVQLYNLTSSTILAITSNSEFTVYSFIKNEIIKQSSNSVNCQFYSNIQDNIFCLEQNNVIKIFNNSSLDFEVISTNLNQNLQINQFQALNQSILSLVDTQGNLILYSRKTQESYQIFQSSESYNKIELIGDYIISLNGMAYLTFFQISQTENNYAFTQLGQVNNTNQQILDYLVLSYQNSFTLAFASTLSINFYNLQSNQLIGYLPVPCAQQSKLKQDQDYIYALCSFQVNVFKKRFLKIVNFYKINQFIYSNLKDIHYIYQDIFVLVLSNHLLVAQINEKSSQILESFQDLNNPVIYSINFLYDDTQNTKLNQINFKCFSDSNIFDIYYQIEGNNQQSQNILLTLTQSAISENNINQDLDNQSRVYMERFNLFKYVITMTIQNSNLYPLSIFYQVFTINSVIEYQFPLDQGNIEKKGVANLIDNQFILSQFYNLNFQTISLQISSTQQNMTLNPYLNMKQIIFKDIEFILQNQTSCLQIDNLNLVILNQIIIQSASLIRQSCAIKFSNITNVLIQNITISSIKILNDITFQFQQITNLTIINMNLIGLQINGNLFEFTDCQYIQIQNLNVQQTSIASGSIFTFFKSQFIQMLNLNFTLLVQTNDILQSRQLNYYQKQRFIQSTSKNQSENLLLNFYGCQNVSIQNSNFERVKELTLIQTNHYSSSNQLQYYSYLIQIINCTVKEITYTKAQQDQIFIITAIQANLFHISFSNITSYNNLINWDVQQQGIIQKSSFIKINLLGGSVIYMVNGYISLIYCNFISINSTNSPCALNTNLDISNEGGAIKLQNYLNFTILYSSFHKCQALQSGGAIFSSQAQQSSCFNVLNCIFQDNISILGSGGAIYFQKAYAISISLSKFESNSANKQQGGAIYFGSCELQKFSNINFKLNKAYIGGSIFYSDTNSVLLSQIKLYENIIIFQNNSAIFYGQNIGSVPFWIGISKYPDVQKLEIVESYNINQISSGNYLSSPLYLNFIDEEKNPLKFTKTNDQNGNYNQYQFQLQLFSQNNSQVIIQQGSFARLNQTIGLFELNFQAIYKMSQEQIIYVISNQFDSGNSLYLQLNLHFRNCQIGEIIQENNKFISLFGDPVKTTINSLDCLFRISDKYPIWIHRIVLQVFNVLALLILVNCSLLYILYGEFRDKKKLIQNLPQTIKMTSIMIYIFYQPSLSKMLIENLFCIQIGSKHYLLSDYSQECHTYYYFIYQLKLKQLQHQDIQKADVIFNIKTNLSYGIMYDGYKHKYLYWEVIKIFHKFIIMIVININQTNQVKIGMITSTIIAYTYFLQNNQPHNNIKLHNTEKMLFYSLLYIYSLVLINLNDSSELQIYATASIILIIILNVVAIKTLIIRIFDQTYIQIEETDSFKNKLKKSVLLLSKKFPNQLSFLKFRQVKIIRIHFLLKKIVIAFRQKRFRKMNNIMDKNNLKETENQLILSEDRDFIRKIRLQKRSTIKKSSLQNQLNQTGQSEFQCLDKNETQIKDNSKILEMTQTFFQAENTQNNENEQNLPPTFRKQEDVWQSLETQMMNTESNIQPFPQSFFESHSQNTANNQNYEKSKLKYFQK
ncbi:hypothetical protein ABPG74_019746 [Tetrahymena malaccensis]